MLFAKKLLLIPVAALLAFSTGCLIEQEEPGEAPEVNVEPGRLPEYDVEGPDVEVGTEEKTIEVPTVDIDPPQRDTQN
ncbi:MAG: hypothetical protein HC890_11785 [Chloroflexaceae bacterium]|nr:hypothetical protein [Chloroflexaceae bacterium]